MEPDNQGAPAANASLADRVCRKAGWRLLPFLALLYFAAFLDRVNIGFAALTMNADLGFSAQVYGIGAGIFFLGYVLFEVPSNMMLQRHGARRWIARIMVTWGILSAAMALVTGPASFYALRLLLGIAEAGFFPGIVFYLSNWFPASYRARIMGVFLMALPLSTVLGAPVSTALLDLEALGLAGWQWLFILEGVPSVLLGLVVLAILPDGPADAKWLKPEEKRWLLTALAEERALTAHARGSSLRDVLTSGRVWVLGLIYCGLVVGLYGFTFWLPTITEELGGLSHKQVGLVSAVPNAFAVIGMLLWGRHSDRTNERVRHLAWPALVGGICFAASGYLTDMPLLVYIAFCFGFVATFIVFPVFWTLPMALLSGPAAAAGIALINSMGAFGGFVGPTVMGMVKNATGSFSLSLWALGVSVALAGLLTLVLARSSPRLATA